MAGDIRRTPAWAAFLIALMPALALILLVETLRVTSSLGAALSLRSLGTFAEITSNGLRQLGSAVLIALIGVVMCALVAARRYRPLAIVALSILSWLQIHLVRETAIEAPYLARSLPVTMIFVVIAALYSVLAIWVTLSDRAPRARRAVGTALLGSSAAAAAAHYYLFVGLYPTIHSSIAVLSFLGAHLGFAMVLAGLSLPRWSTGSLILMPASILAIGLVTPTPAKARGRSYAAAHSALVRPVVIAGTPEHLLRPKVPPRRGKAGPIRPDDDALVRFRKYSGLPTLPEGFDLSDHDVLLVIMDATRFDRTSLADPDLATTPTLQKLVALGAHSFTRTYSPSNGTFPSAASLLSMTYPSFSLIEIHDKHWHGRLRPEQVTVPEVMSEMGHHTFWVGFDFKRVMTLRVHGLEQGFDRHHLELIWPGRDLDADARIAAHAVREIRTARAMGKRYFGMVCLSSPHDDYQVHFPRRPSKTARDRYDQEIQYADHQIKTIVKEVSRGGGLDKTVVIITSDHGEAFGEHRHRFHLSSLYSEQVRVPLVIWVPGSPGSRHDSPTSNLYVLPWLLLEGPLPARRAAERVLRADLGPVLRETKGAVVSEFISRHRQHATLRYDDHTIYYDLISDFVGVFDAQADPIEQRDLREERPELVDRYTPLTQGFRRVRFAGQRYFFTSPN